MSRGMPSRECSMHESFWTHMDTLICSSALLIDRPKGFSRPHAPSVVYPLDYGYLQGTSSSDMPKLNFCSAVPLPRNTLSAIFIRVQLQPRSLSKGVHND